MARPPEALGRGWQVAKVLGLLLLRFVWVSAMVLTPLFGFWLASSLAAYQNASQWLALLGGLALFPLLPVGWELLYAWRRSRQQVVRKPILTRLDRLVLRTLVINGVFLFVMMWQARATAFRALAQRGDWMLDGHDGAAATWVRDRLLALGDRFDARREQRDDDRYGSSDTAPDPWDVRPRDTPKPPTTTVPGEVRPPRDASGWPYPDAPDDKIANMPAEAQTSIAAAGKYILERFPDKKQRVKAIHDFVALRLEYDNEGLAAFESGAARRPPQDAESVFASRKAVCEGYARLMVALGAEANLEIKYVTGWIRDAERRLSATDDTAKAALQGYLHAWNAVLVDEQWFLVDTTWDDPTMIGGPKRREVRSTYLFTPPELFLYDHLPEDDNWQLVMKPISLGDFSRQPFLSPDIGRLGVTIESPKRSQISVDGTATITLANPYEARISAVAHVDGRKSDEGTRCDVTTADKKSTIRCELDRGEYVVSLFGAARDTRGWLDHIGSILVNSR